MIISQAGGYIIEKSRDGLSIRTEDGIIINIRITSMYYIYVVINGELYKIRAEPQQLSEVKNAIASAKTAGDVRQLIDTINRIYEDTQKKITEYANEVLKIIQKISKKQKEWEVISAHQDDFMEYIQQVIDEYVALKL